MQGKAYPKQYSFVIALNRFDLPLSVAVPIACKVDSNFCSRWISESLWRLKLLLIVTIGKILDCRGIDSIMDLLLSADLVWIRGNTIHSIRLFSIFRWYRPETHQRAGKGNRGGDQIGATVATQERCENQC